MCAVRTARSPEGRGGAHLVGVSRQWDLLGAPQCLACVFEKEAVTLNLGPP